MKVSRLVLGSAVAVSLVGAGFMSTPASAQDDCVAIYGGDVFNETVIDLNANAGTAISDASAGSNNAATTNGGGGDEGEVINTASAGNGGVATAAANGGAISTGNINSGGNVGNAIAVGDTYCADVAAYEVPVYDDVVYDVAAADDIVVALPATGVGAGEVGSLFAVLASASAAVASLGLRRR